MCAFTARELDALEALARETRRAREFAALARARTRRGDETPHAAADPGFLPGLVFQVYSAYYQHPRVLSGLGLEPRPPHPKGYALEQPDLDALLAPRARARETLPRRLNPGADRPADRSAATPPHPDPRARA
jgi:hypothetical protein